MMARRKIRLAWIENKTARKASFRKRRAGLLKKMKELITLCGISAFIIINNPDELGPPIIWPSMEEARELYQRFRSVPDVERCKKMMNQEDYLRERSGKMEEQIRKYHKQNQENLTSHILAQIFGQGKPLTELMSNELDSVICVLENYLKEVKMRIHYYNLMVGNQSPGSSSNVPPPLIPDQSKGKEVSWESCFSGILVNNNINNVLLMNNVEKQVPDHRQYFVGGTSHGSTFFSIAANNVVYPNYYGLGRNCSTTGFHIQPYMMNNQNLFGHAISNDQKDLVNFSQQVNFEGSSITSSQPDTHLGQINLESGRVNYEHVEMEVQSGQGDIIMAENHNNGDNTGNVTSVNIVDGKKP
uniref:MADS-box domain-containing protein n=1 Tax=Cannabis sativa TaxID=3483 RepID=A0A803QN43_CANSA